MAKNSRIKADLAVIGAGPGGYVAAIRAAKLKKKVVLIEKENNLGGICLNYGCIPSKAMIYASDFLNRIKNAKNMGVSAEKITMDFSKMQQWKDGIITNLNNGIETLCKGNKIEIVKGTASFESSESLKIISEDNISYIDFEKAIIATGSIPIELPAIKFDRDRIVSSTEILYLKEIPGNLIVIGGGYIGIELGTVYAKLGSKVSVIEMEDQLLPGFDKSVVNVVHKRLEKLGVNIHLNSKAERFDNGRIFINSKGSGEISLEADKVLVAIGRAPNTANLGLENTEAKLDKNGFIKVNENLMTDDQNIYAIGDVSIGPMLAHKASYQGKFVAEIIAGHKERYEDSVVPSVIFTDPEIAIVGLSEEEAKNNSIKTKIGKFPFSISSRAMTKSETEGFVKIIANEEDDMIIGAEIVGADASDLISEVSLAIKMKAKLEDLALTIHPHPTLSESLMEAAEATMGKAIHILNPKS